MVDAHDSGSCGEICEGSSPFPDTIYYCKFFIILAGTPATRQL